MRKPADFANVLNGLMWFQVVFASVFIGLRLYTREFMIRNIGMDDILMIVNLVRSFLTATSRERHQTAPREENQEICGTKITRLISL